MTVYLYCEGVTDYAVIPFLMRTVSNIRNMDVKWIKRNELKKITTHRKSGIEISKPYKYIKALATFSYLNGSKYIAYHQDAGNKYHEVYDTIVYEFQELKEKNSFHCLAIVPKEMIESWLLADENAYPSVPKNPKLPSKPEDLWGNKDNPNHPYKYFVRVLSQFNMSDNSDTYAQIAENTNIEVLKRRCPVSFGRFCTDMLSFVTGESVS
jgi:hypothetical protein